MHLVRNKLIIYLSCIVLSLHGVIFSQGKDIKISTNQYDKKIEEIQKQANVIFRDVEFGLVSSNFDFVAKYFSSQIFISLHGAESGYFSLNQATYILENYFAARRIINFTFTTKKSTGDIPYATGGGYFTIKGKQELFQVYISVAQKDSRTVITLFNVY